jgi:hypothetical protein
MIRAEETRNQTFQPARHMLLFLWLYSLALAHGKDVCRAEREMMPCERVVG